MSLRPIKFSYQKIIKKEQNKKKIGNAGLIKVLLRWQWSNIRTSWDENTKKGPILMTSNDTVCYK